MYKRILTIGDIHGEWDKFQSLYEKIAFKPPDDLLIFLGDYIDRGPKPLRVLEWMMAHEKDPNIIMLRGNHEQMMLDHAVSKATQKKLGWQVLEDQYGEEWLANGGRVTKRCLEKRRQVSTPEAFAAFKSRCFAFMGSLRISFQIEAEGRTFFFCHAGVKPGIPLDQQIPDDLLWIREQFYAHYRGETVVVAGHNPVRDIPLCGLHSGQDADTPLISNTMMLVDTGVCYGGRLSCVDVLSGQFWQNDD